MLENANFEELCNDPYPFYAELRAKGQPTYSVFNNGTSTNLEGIWLVADYKQAVEVFKNTTTISKSSLSIKSPSEIDLFDFAILNLDGVEHDHIHKIMQKLFVSKSLKKIEYTVASLTTELLTKLAAKPKFDFVAEFCDILPLHVISTLIGFSTEHIHFIRQRSLIITDALDSLSVDDNKLQAQRVAFEQVIKLIETEIEQKRRAPSNDFISELIKKEHAGEISANHSKAIILFLLLAGHETTVYLLSTCMMLLLSHPAQLKLLRGGSDNIVQTTIEEVLRYESSKQRTSFRITTQNIDVGGVSIPKGAQIGIIINAVNRDPAIFDNADEFLIERKPNPHLAFGLGTHNCIGKQLARMELKILLSQFWIHLPNVTLEGQPDWRRNTFFRGLNTLNMVNQPS